MALQEGMSLEGEIDGERDEEEKRVVWCRKNVMSYFL